MPKVAGWEQFREDQEVLGWLVLSLFRGCHDVICAYFERLDHRVGSFHPYRWKRSWEFLFHCLGCTTEWPLHDILQVLIGVRHLICCLGLRIFFLNWFKALTCDYIKPSLGYRVQGHIPAVVPDWSNKQRLMMKLQIFVQWKGLQILDLTHIAFEISTYPERHSQVDKVTVCVVHENVSSEVALTRP